MHTENLIQNIYSYLRLSIGCCAVFGGLYILSGGLAHLEWWLGVIIGGIGLAVALHETAYVGARFLAGFLKPPVPSSEPPPGE